MVLDRSGSMSKIQNDVVGGCDNFIKSQAKEPGECKLTLCQFDTVYEEIWSLRGLKDLPSVGTFYAPRGGTALNDAVGRTILSVGAELAKRPENERPSSVIFMIVTDGEENSSQEFRGPEGKARIKQMITHQAEAYGWKFSYMGANVDAFAEAKSYGIPEAASANFLDTKKGMVGSYAAMNSAVLRSRRSPHEAFSYNVGERNQAMGIDVDVPDPMTPPK